MTLDHVGFIDLPPHAAAGGFDQAAIPRASASATESIARRRGILPWLAAPPPPIPKLCRHRHGAMRHGP